MLSILEYGGVATMVFSTLILPIFFTNYKHSSIYWIHTDLIGLLQLETHLMYVNKGAMDQYLIDNKMVFSTLILPIILSSYRHSSTSWILTVLIRLLLLETFFI